MVASGNIQLDKNFQRSTLTETFKMGDLKHIYKKDINIQFIVCEKD